jgi:hypothetical protein
MDVRGVAVMDPAFAGMTSKSRQRSSTVELVGDVAPTERNIEART